MEESDSRPRGRERRSVRHLLIRRIAMSSPNQKPKKRAAGLLIFSQPTNQFLLMRHRDRWDLPKGHCEPGESDLETALRETEEETGFRGEEIEVDRHFHFELTYDVRYKRSGQTVFEKTVVYFLGRMEEARKPVLTEHESFDWFQWAPPHQIQEQTIDPLLHAVERHWAVQ